MTPRQIMTVAALLSTPVAAQTDITPQVRAEAQGYLQICMPGPEDVEAACHRARDEFVADYLRAFAGELAGQRNVGFVLAGGPRLLVPGGPSRPFPVAQNNVQACAWRMVVSSSGRAGVTDADAAHQRAVCGRLDAPGIAAAQARARQIGGQINANPVPNPPAR